MLFIDPTSYAVPNMCLKLLKDLSGFSWEIFKDGRAKKECIFCGDIEHDWDWPEWLCLYVDLFIPHLFTWVVWLRCCASLTPSFLKFVWNKNTLLLISFSCCFVVYHKILLTFSLRWITSQVFKSIYKKVAVAEWIKHWLWNPAVRVQIPVREKSFLQRKLGKSEQDLWYTKK